MGRIFKFIVFTFLENTLNLGSFTHTPLPHSKRQIELFENLFPSTAISYHQFFMVQYFQRFLEWLDANLNYLTLLLVLLKFI